MNPTAEDLALTVYSQERARVAREQRQAQLHRAAVARRRKATYNDRERTPVPRSADRRCICGETWPPLVGAKGAAL